jgi:mono/diheme cytochrome c family protein
MIRNCVEKNLLREGRELFANQRCQRCHPAGANEQVAYTEWNLDAPDSARTWGIG